MGCDIHLVLEVKHGDKWIGMRAVTNMTYYSNKDGELKRDYIFVRAIDRDYGVFAKLAGVRGDGPAPKGIPEDVSDLARAAIDQWDTDGHSHSYCSVQHFMEILLQSSTEPAQVFLIPDHPATKDPFTYFFNMPELEGLEDVAECRCVFWFDN